MENIVPDTTAHYAATPDLSIWLTAQEAAQYLHVKRRTLLSWVRKGKVKGYALSGTKRHIWRFRRIDLDAKMLGPAVLTEGRIN